MDFLLSARAAFARRENAEMSVVRKKTKKLIDELPKTSARDDGAYELYVKQKLAWALDEAARGKVVSHEAAKQQMTSQQQPHRPQCADNG